VKKYLIAILFYLAGSVLVTIPVLLAFFSRQGGFEIFDFIKVVFIFKFNVFALLALILFFGLVLLSDLSIFIKTHDAENTIRNVTMLLGERNFISLNLILCILTGYFEETLFRVIMYSLTLILLMIILPVFIAIILSVILISAVFSVFHMTQGVTGLVTSFVISVIFFISILVTQTIWYAVAFHFLFNFIELSFVFPYQKKKLFSQP
jgi:membrane protease YdiL (CAAX protease family)